MWSTVIAPEVVSASGRSGVYGFAITGLVGAERLLAPAGPEWPELAISSSIGVTGLQQHLVTTDRAELMLQGGGEVFLERSPLRAHFRLPAPSHPENFVHPFLSSTAGVIGQWSAQEVLHGGAFVLDGGAWVVLGTKGQGKSTLMGWCAVNGIQVITDDVCFVTDGHVLRGPNCVDLRPDAASFMGVGEPLGLVGARERNRLVFEAGPKRVPLRGWVLPEWGKSTALDAVPVPERLQRIMANVLLYMPSPDPLAVLSYAALPTFVFRRPRSWSGFDAANSYLLSGLRELAPPDW